MQTALVAAAVFLIAATLLPLSRSDAWWVRGFDFPRLQILALMALVGAGFAWMHRDAEATSWPGAVVLVALAACAAHQLWMMYPYLRIARPQVQRSEGGDPGSVLRMLTANVLMTNRDAARLLAIVRDADPDVILLVETDAWWQAQLDVLRQSHPHAVEQPQDNTYGMLLYSRLPLVDPKVEFLVQRDIPSIHTGVQLPAGVRVALHCLHPRPPFPTEDDSSTSRDAELLVVGKGIKARSEPVVVMGDLNDVAWSRTNYLFQDISGLLDPRIGRGFFNTFHAKLPLLRFPLDHFFHSNHFRLVDFRRLAAFGSDHFPVFIALSCEASAAAQQPQLHADAGEKREAERKIDKAAEA
jgi:endonuclease/exonuclease/phosphatase (EEP) superfamily protein YafD